MSSTAAWRWAIVVSRPKTEERFYLAYTKTRKTAEELTKKFHGWEVLILPISVPEVRHPVCHWGRMQWTDWLDVP